jgi:hypothetical protein
MLLHTAFPSYTHDQLELRRTHTIFANTLVVPSLGTLIWIISPARGSLWG